MEGQLEGLNEAIEEAEGLLQGDEEDELTENARRRLGAKPKKDFMHRERIYSTSSIQNRRWTRENKAFARRIRSFGGANKNYPTGTEEARRQQEAQEEARRR